MHTGVSGQIRKTGLGRFVLFHINTGLFWIYGILTFALAFSLSGFWIQSSHSRLILSLSLALVAAFTFASMVHALFWRRFRNVWMDNYVIGIFLVVWLVSECVHDMRDSRTDVLPRLATRILAAVVAGFVSYASNRKNAA